jgi:hypothetical protein
MNPADEQSGIAALAHGDEASARELRADLAVFARRTDSPEIRSMVTEVLAGRRNVREVFASREFNEAGLRHLANVEHGIAQLSDEQRVELFNPNRPCTPDDKLAAMRDDGIPAPAEQTTVPSGDGAVSRRPRPAAVDEDDEDFSQKSYTERAF